MAVKKTTAKATTSETTKTVAKEETKKRYVVIEPFTEAGKSRGYTAGEEWPREDDPISDESVKKLLGDNVFRKAFIKEK